MSYFEKLEIISGSDRTTIRTFLQGIKNSGRYSLLDFSVTGDRNSTPKDILDLNCVLCVVKLRVVDDADFEHLKRAVHQCGANNNSAVAVVRDMRLTKPIDLSFLSHHAHPCAILRKEVDGTIARYLYWHADHKGVYDFKVLCDETNNPPDLVNSGKARCNIYMQGTSEAIDRWQKMWSSWQYPDWLTIVLTVQEMK